MGWMVFCLLLMWSQAFAAKALPEPLADSQPEPGTSAGKLTRTLANRVVQKSAGQLPLEKFASQALQSEINYQESLTDLGQTEARSQAAQNLSKGQLKLGPFWQSYQIIDPAVASASSFKDSGLAAQWTQLLPTGTAFTVGSSIWAENTRMSTAAKKQTYYVTLSQSLWKNQFGSADRLNANAAEATFAAQKVKTDIAMLEGCQVATKTYLSAWAQEAKNQVNNEMLALASELYKKSERSYGVGQIGALDWLGIKSDYLNFQTLRVQSTRNLESARDALEYLVPGARNLALVDPSQKFDGMLQKALSLTPSALPRRQQYLENLSRSLELKAQAEQRNTLPDLSFDLKKSVSSGNYVSSAVDNPFRDDDFTLALNLTWKFNDKSNDLDAALADQDRALAILRYELFSRSRNTQFEESQRGLRAVAEELKLEQDRNQVLMQIVAESKKRFVQGRLEFQDFLRVKEQWYQSQIQHLDKKTSHWLDLFKFVVDEGGSVEFCSGGAQ